MEAVMEDKPIEQYFGSSRGAEQNTGGWRASGWSDRVLPLEGKKILVRSYADIHRLRVQGKPTPTADERLESDKFLPIEEALKQTGEHMLLKDRSGNYIVEEVQTGPEPQWEGL